MNLSQTFMTSIDELNSEMQEASFMSVVSGITSALKRLRLRHHDSVDHGRAVIIVPSKSSLIVVRPEVVEVYKGEDVKDILGSENYTVRTSAGSLADVKKIIAAIADSSINVRQVLKQSTDKFNAEKLVGAI